ncbi:AI-2E family transporter [Cellulomonas palmilytica]|uniref:AI-2E family transporter n=1 Tax=Cellulomonas palmilytica TaxID=2608402 RepID=UPI001F230B49|nr:AI-2E family transporter [Cellulomonas palmilytica]UJP39257.1 AI-2E family transporter [Cellulomonas palmilytica]
MPKPRTAFDARRPPAWLPRALLMCVLAVFAAVLVWRSLGLLTNVITIIAWAWFIALAMEPPIRWLVRRGIRRTRATGLVMLTAGVLITVVIALFGSLFVQQVVDFVKHLPEYYENLAEWLDDRFGAQIPTADEALDTIGNHWQDLAPGLIGAGASLLGGIFNASSILLVTYYMASAGPRFRAAVLAYLEPGRQREVLRVWEVSQEKVADFINSRVVLAALSTVFTWVFFVVIQLPYALPLAAFTGVVSQFVPTIGTYIGGALPVAVALTVSPLKALLVLAWIIAYQQLENYVFSPKISARALQLNPAVSFLGVIGFGAVFGAMGAFLALPVMATIQAVASTYVRRHEIVDDPLLHEDAEAMRRNRGWEDVETETAPDAPRSWSERMRTRRSSAVAPLPPEATDDDASDDGRDD